MARTDRRTRQVTLSAGILDVVEAGAGEPIVLLHGVFVDAALWDPLVDELVARGYRCVVPTLPLGAHRHAMAPGTDLTPPGLAALVTELLTALEVTPATVVSNDTATALTQLVLADHPGTVGRAVLTSGDCFEYFFPPIFRPLLWAGRVPALLRPMAWSVRNRWLRRLPFAFGLLALRGISDDLGRRWSEPLLTDAGVRRDATAVLRGVDPRHTLAVAERLHRVDVPVLLAWGEDDRAFPRRLAERLAGAIPGARLETVPSSATYISIDNPGRLAELIDGFVRPGDPERGAGRGVDT